MRYCKKMSVAGFGAVLSILVTLWAGGHAFASQLTVPNTFNNGATISSSQMNDNFTAVKTANDDNDTRITNLEKRNITVLTFTGGNSTPATPTTWTQYTAITPSSLSFTKNSATSTILVTWNDTLVGHSITASLGFCMWDLRIDGAGNNTSFINWPTYSTSDTSLPISTTATYTGLPAGAHTVELWLNTTNAACYNNAGGWTRTVTVQEVP